MGTYRESDALIAGPTINTASALHLRPHQHHRPSRSTKQHRQAVKRARFPAHPTAIPLLPCPLRDRNGFLPPPHPDVAELQLPPSFLCGYTALPSQSAHQHGAAGLEFHEVVSAATAGVELRSAEQRERCVVGGHY